MSVYGFTDDEIKALSTRRREAPKNTEAAFLKEVRRRVDKVMEMQRRAELGRKTDCECDFPKYTELESYAAAEVLEAGGWEVKVDKTNIILRWDEPEAMRHYRKGLWWHQKGQALFDDQDWEGYREWQKETKRMKARERQEGA